MPNLAQKLSSSQSPTTLHECLTPLAAAALETSIRAYQWGLANGTLFRAGTIMDLCDAVLRESNKLLAHATSEESTKRAVAAQRQANEA